MTGGQRGAGAGVLGPVPQGDHGGPGSHVASGSNCGLSQADFPGGRKQPPTSGSRPGPQTQALVSCSEQCNTAPASDKAPLSLGWVDTRGVPSVTVSRTWTRP